MLSVLGGSREANARIKMRKTLQIIALLLGFATSASWLVTGANRGWTKTSVPVKTADEVTGIEGISYRKQFLPGIDFLAAAWGTAGVLAGASLCFSKKTKPTTITK